MKIVYKTFGKIFETEKECLEYEDKILAEKKNIALNLGLYYRFKPVAMRYERERVALPCFFTGSRRKMTFGKYKGYYVCAVILEDCKYIERCKSKIKGFTLTENEQLLWDAINDIENGPHYLSLQSEYPEWEIIDLLEERYLKQHIDPYEDDDFDNVFVCANDKIEDDI